MRPGLRTLQNATISRRLSIVVPAYGPDGEIQSLQYIIDQRDQRGRNKFNHAGASTRGAYFVIRADLQHNDCVLWLCAGLGV